MWAAHPELMTGSGMHRRLPFAPQAGKVLPSCGHRQHGFRGLMQMTALPAASQHWGGQPAAELSKGSQLQAVPMPALRRRL